jgi:hypothetical protein
MTLFHEARKDIYNNHHRLSRAVYEEYVIKNELPYQIGNERL